MWTDAIDADNLPLEMKDMVSDITSLYILDPTKKPVHQADGTYAMVDSITGRELSFTVKKCNIGLWRGVNTTLRDPVEERRLGFPLSLEDDDSDDSEETAEEEEEEEEEEERERKKKCGKKGKKGKKRVNKHRKNESKQLGGDEKETETETETLTETCATTTVSEKKKEKEGEEVEMREAETEAKSECVSPSVYSSSDDSSEADPSKKKKRTKRKKPTVRKTIEKTGYGTAEVFDTKTPEQFNISIRCGVCGARARGDPKEDLSCVGCGVMVHIKCIDGEQGQEQTSGVSFKCSYCANPCNRTGCPLCYTAKSELFMQPMKHTSGLVHSICKNSMNALLRSDDFFEDLTRKCVICSHSGGVVKCFDSHCDRWFHMSCAWVRKYQLKRCLLPGKKGVVKIKAICLNHEDDVPPSHPEKGIESDKKTTIPVPVKQPAPKQSSDVLNRVLTMIPGTTPSRPPHSSVSSSSHAHAGGAGTSSAARDDPVLSSTGNRSNTLSHSQSARPSLPVPVPVPMASTAHMMTTHTTVQSSTDRIMKPGQSSGHAARSEDKDKEARHPSAVASEAPSSSTIRIKKKPKPQDSDDMSVTDRHINQPVEKSLSSQTDPLTRKPSDMSLIHALSSNITRYDESVVTNLFGQRELMNEIIMMRRIEWNLTDAEAHKGVVGRLITSTGSVKGVVLGVTVTSSTNVLTQLDSKKTFEFYPKDPASSLRHLVLFHSTSSLYLSFTELMEERIGTVSDQIQQTKYFLLAYPGMHHNIIMREREREKEKEGEQSSYNMREGFLKYINFAQGERERERKRKREESDRRNRVRESDSERGDRDRERYPERPNNTQPIRGRRDGDRDRPRDLTSYSYRDSYSHRDRDPQGAQREGGDSEEGDRVLPRRRKRSRSRSADSRDGYRHASDTSVSWRERERSNLHRSRGGISTSRAGRSREHRTARDSVSADTSTQPSYTRKTVDNSVRSVDRTLTECSRGSIAEMKAEVWTTSDVPESKTFDENESEERVVPASSVVQPVIIYPNSNSDTDSTEDGLVKD
eukprot:CAMPEP_0182440912 /NCGR_PEP_ID=MMETSP1167-20130531/86623_1 /TAXON_ID=2988 /ORGANISM="Mallomonas Sp, Strain CCMP3275" /LENGTH=1034 /DNA_ID=CAMNT_0024635013 /DNA_START=595 /DNA_END=3701 /DNA_ORIENTATION=-